MKVTQIITFVEDVANTINRLGIDNIWYISVFYEGCSVRALIIYKEDDDNGTMA